MSNHTSILDIYGSVWGFFGPGLDPDWSHSGKQVCGICTLGFGKLAKLYSKRIKNFFLKDFAATGTEVILLGSGKSLTNDILKTKQNKTGYCSFIRSFMHAFQYFYYPYPICHLNWRSGEQSQRKHDP